ncbi:MAG: DNA translocase FtsK [Wujia sp.]
MATGNKSVKTSNTGNNTKKKNTGTDRKGKIDNTYTKQRKEAARQALEDEKEGNTRVNEIYIFIYLAVSLFLLCSNFGWCGVVGNAISKFIFGMLGTVAYILPIYIFFSAAFLLANGSQKKIVKRVLCVALILIAVAFVCQLITGTSGMDVKTLYSDGAKYKKGGGVLLGGILVLLHKLIGFTGSIIVIALITIIGIIVVLDVSLLDMIKNSVSSEDDEYENDNIKQNDNAVTANKRSNKNKNVLDSIRVLESDNTKSKSKKQNNKNNSNYNEEEVHELKPLTHKDVFEMDDAFPLEQSQNKDFFANDVTDFDINSDEFSDGLGYQTDEDFGQAIQSGEAQKHRRKRTKETYAEMVDERDNISNMDNVKEVAAKPISQSEETVKPQSGKAEDTTEGYNISTSAVGPVKEYQFPPVNLLKTSKVKGVAGSDAEVRNTAMKLKSTLENFGVNVTVTNYSCGPSVTRYELQPEQGVKVSKIVGLADDIKLNLAAADIRIEAPIPGKAAIGIEVPNKESSPVYFGDLLESETFKKFPSKIAFAVGKDISGQVIVADIAKMPHLLVAGATGSGKSVCINTLIMSILYKANPDDVKLIMVDPKQVELSIYNGIPHMLIPVVTDPKKAAGALNWAVMEMTNRYQLFAQYNVRNLQGYNDKVKSVTGSEEGNEELKKLPQIVIIVDELADLMMVAHGEVEDAIVRLSQLARAAGIHLVIATQRPSVDVITGLIKANVPSRIAMTVSSGVDSRTILDMNGAEKLLGKGDMLFYPTGYPKPVRVQGAFLSDEEIASVVDFIKAQYEDVTYDDNITSQISNAVNSGQGQSGGSSDLDEYFVDAGKFIIGKDKASIGMLQRVYKIGFNRAARIMDQLSEAGVVGPEEGTKPRKVLMTMEEFENYVEEYL